VTRRSVSSVVLGVLASLVLATNVAAAPPNWTAAKTIRSATDIQLGDADFMNQNVAIAWDEPDHPRGVGIATSNNSGSTFGVLPSFVFSRSREPAVDLCGGPGSLLNMVVSHRNGPGNWVIEYTDFESFDSSFTTLVAPTDGLQHDADIACAGGRIFVSWFEEESGGNRLFLAHATRNGGDFSSPIDLGFDATDFPNGLAVAGANDMAYAVFSRTGGDLRFRSWSVGGAPNYPVSANPGLIIGPGTQNNPAFQPVIAAAGDKVAVAWMTCHAIFARVSNDMGQTWGPIRTLIEHAACDGDFIAAPNSIAVRASRIAVEYTAFGIVGDGDENLIRTTNDFASFSDDQISSVGRFTDFVGYVTVAGNVKLADVFQAGNNIRFRRQQ
jgi:hypothetical protein